MGSTHKNKPVVQDTARCKHRPGSGWQTLFQNKVSMPLQPCCIGKTLSAGGTTPEDKGVPSHQTFF